MLVKLKLNGIHYNQGHILLKVQGHLGWGGEEMCITNPSSICCSSVDQVREDLIHFQLNIMAKCIENFSLQLHGRSREQRYTRLADWDYINQCAEAGKPMPVFGKTFTRFIMLSSCS